MTSPKPQFFKSAAEFRAWLTRNHAKAQEVLVGFYKAGTDRPTLSWPDAVDEALCFGWIDGVRKGIDDERYQMRFSPRKPGSNWSAVNVRKAEALIKAGRMKPPGLAAWKARISTPYSYEKPSVAGFAPAEESAFKSNPAGWKDWNARAPSYRKAATNWVTSAKREETRKSRLEILIRSSAAGEIIPPFRYGSRK